MIDTCFGTHHLNFAEDADSSATMPALEDPRYPSWQSSAQHEIVLADP